MELVELQRVRHEPLIFLEVVFPITVGRDHCPGQNYDEDEGPNLPRINPAPRLNTLDKAIP